MICEICNEEFEVIKERGWNNRISCYYCNSPQTTDRNKHLKRKYGITQFQFKQMLIEQNNQCKLCSVTLNEVNLKLVKGFKRTGNECCIDHCHQTGKVRGLLCFHCNTALGHLFDNPEVIDRMKGYLNGHGIN